MATPIFSVSLKSPFFHSLLLFFLFFSNEVFAYERREIIENHNLHHSHFILVSSLLPAAVCNPSTKSIQNKRVSLTVAHKHGPCSQIKASEPSPTHNLNQDQSRVNIIQSKLSNSVPNSKTTLPVKYGNVVASGSYIVTVGLGSPSRQLSLVFDTGSDLTWTQCQPCAGYCYKQMETIFNPSESRSYSNITCNSTLCSQLSLAKGCSMSTCIYGIRYGDQSYSKGLLGKEKLTLSPTDMIDDFLFGCGQNNQGLFGSTAGILGLGRENLSLVSQTAQKYGRVFSYCIPSKASSTGHLSLGSEWSGDSHYNNVKFTPLLINPKYPSFYFINMVGISVGGRKLTIPESVFSSGGTIIDSGTVITRLPPVAYAAMRSAFREMMSNYTMVRPLSILDTCYDFSRNESVSIPKISFYFGGGVEVEVDVSGRIYVESVSQSCLAFSPNMDGAHIAIFGNAQQQTFNVVYDVAGGKLGFGPGGCD